MIAALIDMVYFLVVPQTHESCVEPVKSEAPVHSSTDFSALVSEIKRVQDGISGLTEKFEEFVLHFKLEPNLSSQESAKLSSSIDVNSTKRMCLKFRKGGNSFFFLILVNFETPQ